MMHAHRPTGQEQEGSRERPLCLGVAIEASLHLLAGWQSAHSGHAAAHDDGAATPEHQTMSRAAPPCFSHVLVITCGPCTKVCESWVMWAGLATCIVLSELRHLHPVGHDCVCRLHRLMEGLACLLLAGFHVKLWYPGMLTHAVMCITMQAWRAAWLVRSGLTSSLGLIIRADVA